MILNNMILREGMFMQLTYKVDDKNTVDFNNNVDFCVGTGRMGLALQKMILRMSKGFAMQ